ncbi:PLD nuclease N-terminal domain-containing protein [Solibacillus daqui]|uniref:PLD nuclease N-terminal domain-containing protein n=1 Tax=Solibacillus daqui TaxID=2912187 RepID=UPI0023672179|nr:PLD nuclease N-terminal domain-containing protein [Solibacillus daqui]
MKLHYGVDDLKKIDILSYLPIILPILIIGALLVLIALVDLFRHRNTRNNVLIWTLVILLGNTFGPILYFIFGRKDSDTR